MVENYEYSLILYLEYLVGPLCSTVSQAQQFFIKITTPPNPTILIEINTTCSKLNYYNILFNNVAGAPVAYWV